MDKQDVEHSSPSTLQPMVAILGAILAFSLIIALLMHVPAEGDTKPVVANAEENIKPVAAVEVAATSSGAHTEKSGEEVVKAVCAMCHAAGLMSAPKIGDKAQWAPRIAQGYETLVKHATEGIRSMPARGGNPDLSDAEIAGAVANMANQAGANFDPAKLGKK